MKTVTYQYTNQPLPTIIDFDLYKYEENILIQIFCGEGKETLEKISKELKENIPKAHSIGTTTDGEINNHKVLVQTTIISISVFDNTTIKSSHISLSNCFDNGVFLAKDLITSNTKLLILFSDGTTSNGEEFLKGIHSIAPNITIAGGMAGDNGELIQTYISQNSTILKSGAAGVSLNSNQLYIKNDFSFNWQSIGLEHTIKKAKDNRVYMIDDLSAVDFYIKYLGYEIGDKLPATGIEFPLIIQKNGYKVARAVISKHEDNSLSFAGNLSCGDKVKLGFGNAELIMRDSLESLENIYTHDVETFFIYSCMARRRYMPRFIEMEIKPFALHAPTAGFFTYGEFFHKDGKNKLLNQSLTVVALSEEKIEKKPKQVLENLSKEHTDYATTIGALMHLVNKSTDDYAQKAKKVHDLLEQQKIFIRHAMHETNTPIAVIINNIELFKLEHGDNPYLANIEAATKNLFTISDDLSYIIKKNQIKDSKQVISLSDYVKSRIDFFNSLAIQSKLSFVFKESEADSSIFINETKLQRIVDNNLTNAIKYTDQNESIYIDIYSKKEYIFLKISSKSTHIQHPKRVFKAYYREEKTKSGLGLGLSLVKQICKEEDIKITLKSDEKKTSFTYRFKRSNI